MPQELGLRQGLVVLLGRLGLRLGPCLLVLVPFRYSFVIRLRYKTSSRSPASFANMYASVAVDAR